VRRMSCFFVLALCCARLSGAQDTSIVPAANRTTWKPGIQGGIPVRTTVCANLQASAFGNGAQDASGAIQKAVDGCPVGQVVQLSAGTFTVNSFVLIKKSITLRGAGPNATTLQKTNGAIFGQGNQNLANEEPILLVGPGRFVGPDSATAVDLTANGTKGSMSVTVSSTAGFSAGQFVLLDADDFNNAAWMPLPNRSGKPAGHTVWASDRVAFKRSNPPAQGDDPFPDSLTWFSRAGRPVAEVKEVASVNGKTVTFTTPLHIDYPTSKTAQLVRYPEGHVRDVGIEDLKLIGGSDGNIRLECVAYSWIRNTENTVWIGTGVGVNSAFRVEVRDSYLHDAALSVPGGIAYAISLASGSSEVLVENNIILKANKMIVARSSGAGSVVGYNYMDDGFIDYVKDWNEVGLNASHMVGSHHVLMEGNEAFNYDSDNEHGGSIYMTIFRNHLVGFRRTIPGLSNARAAGLNFGSWWHAFIGNVLGVDGQMQGWVYEQLGTHSDPTDPFGGPRSIWKLGYQNGIWDQAADPKVLSTVLRDGNFDYVTREVRWDRTAQTLPPSLYLTSRPQFFGNNPWPWVDPTGAIQVGVLPATQRYLTTVPAAPRNLRILPPPPAAPAAVVRDMLGSLWRRFARYF
jgi:Pectate lyase superfamily protein